MSICYCSWWSLVRKCSGKSFSVWWWSKPSTDTLSPGKTRRGSNRPSEGCKGETNSAKVEISLVSDPVWTRCNFLALAWNQSWTTLLRLTRPTTPRRRRRSPGRSRRWAWDSEIVSILEVWSAFFLMGYHCHQPESEIFCFVDIYPCFLCRATSGLVL